MSVFTTNECVKAISTYFFLAILTFASFRFLFKGDNGDKSIQKVIGGFSVFIVAIISQNAWILAASLFIGGLIIASEKFMKALAAILRADSGNLPDTIKALESLDVTTATKKEVNEKKKEEEIISGKKTVLKAQLKKEEISEELLSDYFYRKYGEKYLSGVKLENSYGSIIIDGIVRSQSEENPIETLIEIRYLDYSIIKSPQLEQFVKAILEKVRLLLLTAPVTLVIVSNGLTLETVTAKSKELESKYKGINLLFFNLIDDKVIEPVRSTNEV